MPDKDAGRDRLDRATAALFRQHGWMWYGRPSQPAGWRAGWHDLFRQFDRGLLTALRIPGRLAHLAADLQGLFAAEPVAAIAFDAVGVRADHFRAVRRLAMPPRPVRLTFGRVSHTGDPVGYLAAVAGAPFASAVVAIDATSCGNQIEVALAFARSPFLANLRELILDGYRLPWQAASALAAAPGLSNLERLWVKGAELWSSNLDVLRLRFGDRLVV